MELVCIIGIDGAGKSTLAKKIVSRLKEEGVNAHYVYGRTIPFISRALMSLGRFFFLRQHDLWKDFTKYSTDKRKVMKNPFLRVFYTVSILLDYYIQIWVKLLPSILRKQTAVLDRYIYDTVINDLAIHLGYSSERTLRAIECGLKFLPHPALLILLDISEETAFSRKTDIPHIDYLRERRGFYLALDRQPNFHRVNGELDQYEVLAEALHLYYEKYKGKAG